ncbi:disulfide bond formation protein B [Neobacillus notoginsengisoli]|uniref:Probable disulfide formation protein n=1 Tax=Neobacillus notoginsengisoli TaxID=1578198 RepID=A0A417YKX9_9BACI|nr:disulfide oxidoreductase [Neobacillus notoginsengisoli]RHW34129.1 disulfide bond formation protein B [Neobacillus notoginsengisoli]
MEKDNQENILFFAWAVSIIALFGSLYFSEIRKYEPCELCWYQRILMYPMALLLGIAIVKKDYRIAVYSKWLSVIGMAVSAYHYSLQKLSFMAEAAPACGRIPCTGQYINWLGFITIPFLALIAFTLIFACSMILSKREKGVQ